jgi:serine phosphatase RsbU (regulator of sigma subunit)
MAEVLAAVQRMLEHERHAERLFATLCMMSVRPDRHSGVLHLAGHPPPLLISPSGVTELVAPACMPPGITHASRWPTVEVELGERWTVVLYTDGLVEGRIGTGSERLGSDGLISGIKAAVSRADGTATVPSVEQLLDGMIGHAQQLNGGDLDDDLAVLALDYDGRES